MPLTDLLLFTGSVYGLAWLLTRARLTAGLRLRLTPVPFLGALLQCIVCTGTWIAMAVLVAARWSTLFSPTFRAVGPVDAVLLLGWAMATTWVIARATGDAT